MFIEPSVVEKFYPFFDREKYRYKVAYGGRGGGKSYSFAQILIILSMQNKLKILCTREVQDAIKDSVKADLTTVIETLKLGSYFKITKEEIVCNITGSIFLFKGIKVGTEKSQSIKSLTGIDICWVEEAQTLTKESFKILNPTIRKENSEIWFSFNRLQEHDFVYDDFVLSDREDILSIEINYYENPYLSNTLKREAAYDKEHNYEDYRHVWLGYPQPHTGNSIIDRSFYKERIGNPDFYDDGVRVMGVDVARFGKDRSVLIIRRGYSVDDSDIYIFEGLDNVELANEILRLESEVDLIQIDDTGLGGGVTDQLTHSIASGKVVPINFAERATDYDRFPNITTEMWFNFKDILAQTSLPQNTTLLDEVCGRLYKYDNKQRHLAEIKANYKIRLGNSPDLADAFMLAFYNTSRRGVLFYEVDLDVF